MNRQAIHKLQSNLKSLGARLRSWRWDSSARRKNMEGEDCARCADAARLLQASEFEFFRLSYARWYGRTLSESAAERFFSGYLLSKEVPFWVRHCSRQILSRYEEGTLDPREFGVDLPPPPRESPVVGRCLLLFRILLAFILFLLLSGYLSL